jgi:hypothetical protein
MHASHFAWYLQRSKCCVKSGERSRELLASKIKDLEDGASRLCVQCSELEGKLQACRILHPLWAKTLHVFLQAAVQGGFWCTTLWLGRKCFVALDHM